MPEQAVQVGDVVYLCGDIELGVPMTVTWVYQDSVDVGWHDGNQEYCNARLPASALREAGSSKRLGFSEAPGDA